MKHGIVFRALFVLLFFAACASAASRITDIELSSKRIKETNSFKIQVIVKNPESGVLIDFYVDERQVNTVNVGASKDEYESNTIDLKEDPLTCGTHTAKAILRARGGDDIISQLSTDFSVGNLPNITIEPEKPLVNHDVKIKLTDPDTGEPLIGVKVQVKYTDKMEDKITKGSTKLDGIYDYTPPISTRYRVDLDDKDYCGNVYFYAKNTMRVDGPHPENPAVGELIQLAVPTGVGVRVLDANGDTYLTAFTTAGGGVNFTINDAGQYTIVIGEVSTRYWGINKSITVAPKPTPEVSFTPDRVVAGKTVIVSVTAGGQPLENAAVTISGPDKVTASFTTPATGTVSFTPTTSGEYAVKVEKPRYDTTSKTVMVKNELFIDTEPQAPLAGSEFTIIARNQMGTVVPGVEITVDGNKMGITDTNGRYTLTLAEDKNYTIFASKNDIAYWDTTAIIAPTKDIQIVLEKDEVRVGENATVKVYDRNGNKLDAAVRVRDPKGETKQLVGSTFTTKEVGTYTITASKEGKGEASKELTVKPSLLNIQWETKGRNLQIKVSDKGKPLENISVTFTGLVNGTLLTKDDGKVKVPLKKSGNYTIEVNTANANPMYEPATQTREIHKDNRVWLLILLMLIAAALTAIALAAVHKKDMAWITAHKKDTTWQTSKKTTPSLSEKGLRGVR